MSPSKFVHLILYIILIITLGGCKKDELIINEDPIVTEDFRNKIIAHRGVWMNNYLEQNSLNAINLSKGLAIWGCEIDIRETIDGCLILSHDSVISNLEIKKHTYHDLKIAATKEGRDLATLNEALILLEEIGGNMVVEVKEANVSRIKQVVDFHPSLKNHLSFMSFSKEICKSLINNELKPTYLLKDNNSINYNELIKDGYSGIAIDRAVLGKDLNIFHKCKNNKLSVLVWTIRNSPEIFSYINLGVDYVITDIPQDL